MISSYYVYKVEVNEEVIYIGSGQGDRYLHTISGKSHSALLNEHWFTHTLLGGPKPVVTIVERFKRRGEAHDFEAKLIAEGKPSCNIVRPLSRAVRKAREDERLEKIQKEKDMREDFWGKEADSQEDTCCHCEDLGSKWGTDGCKYCEAYFSFSEQTNISDSKLIESEFKRLKELGIHISKPHLRKILSNMWSAIDSKCE